MYATTFMAPALYRDLFNHFPDAAGHPSRLGDQRRNSEGLHRQPLLQLDRLRVLHQHGHQVGLLLDVTMFPETVKWPRSDF